MKGARKMNRQKLSQQVVWIILITLLLVGCDVPAATLTPFPPTAAPAPTSGSMIGSVIEVTFDGTECTVSGSTELPIGEYSFVYKDLSEENVPFWVARLLDGRTFQDLLDLQSEPGEYYPKPSWTVYPSGSWTWNESIDAGVYTFSLDKEGEYATAVGGDFPPSLWLCAPLWVIEAPSE
jgi:hypothetical protein